MKKFLSYFLIALVLFPGPLRAQEAKLQNALDRYRTQSEVFFAELKAKAVWGSPQEPKRSLSPEEIFAAARSFEQRWNARTALLCYFYNSSKQELSSFLLNSREVIGYTTRKISKDSMLQEEVEFRNLFGVYRSTSLNRGSNSGSALKPKLKEGDSLAARRISTLVLPPSLADSLLSYDQLLISPALNLYSFPFTLLKPFRGDAFLGTSIPVCILPNLYEFCTKGTSSNEIEFKKRIRKATIVGNPKFNQDLHPRDFYGRHPVIDEFFLPELPYTEAQTTGVKTLLVDNSGTIEIDFLSQMKATRSAFLQSASQSDLVYLATHGFSSMRSPWDSSFIAFAREEGKPGLNFLSAGEIVSGNFPARLVVLSACQTGTGQAREAGVVSLASAFYFAGAENVVSTLWNVDDFFTSMYMREFMKGIIEEGNKHPSYYLYRVQKNAKSSPRYWAPFICFGR